MHAANSDKSRILVVDDDPDICSLVSLWLTREGFEVATAASGTEALRKIAADRPDLIITDLKMDGMSGIDLLNEVHKDSPMLPIIMLSGQALIPDAVRATHLGSAAFLTKPVVEEDLVGTVRRVMRLGGNRERRDGVFSELVGNKIGDECR